MNFVFLAVILTFLTLGLWVSQVASRTLYDTSMLNMHEQWMTHHGRDYNNVLEKEMRFKIFKENVERIESLNKLGNRSFKLSVNEFADQSNEEFKAGRNGYKKLPSGAKSYHRTSFKYENISVVPSSVDWRKKGAVTAIKDQGQCGSCWAFSAVAATEGITQIKTGKLISLSEQELIECDRKGIDQGCEGGVMDNAFEFILQNKGLTTESNYPYTGDDGTACNSKQSAFPAAKITGYKDVPANNENALLMAVLSQPVSVAIDAGGYDFQFYSSGVFTGECGVNLDHGVTAVGYGVSEDGTKYWLVKNSWGSGWGENGYIRMERGVSEKEGLCGIAMEASFPTL